MSNPIRKRAYLLLIFVSACLVAALVLFSTAFAPAAAIEVGDAATVTTAATATTAAAALTPTTEATPTTVAAGPSVDYSTAEIEFVRLLNDYRADNGLDPLLLSDVVTVACDRHSADMATYDFVNHYTGYYRASSGSDLPLKGTRSDYFATGADPCDRMVECGYDYDTAMGENLAAGCKTPADALKALKASKTHDANLLSADYKVIGISLVYSSDSEYGYYWTTDFGGYVDATAHAAATVVASAD